MSSVTEEKPTEEKPPVAGNEYEDAEKNFQPKSPKFWAIMFGLYISIFLIALDRMIIATAIPVITNEFNSIADIGWYGSAYMLTAASFNPVFGRIYQLYSTKWVFLLSIVIFEVGSVICGAAPSSTAFIIGRAIAGLGSAGVFSGGMMIMLPLVPLRKRPMFVSIFGMAFGISSVVGPIVGGAFTDNVSWRWCFYVNLPIGGFTMIAMLLFLRIESPKRETLPITAQIKRLDPIGTFFFLPSIISLILALEWGGTVYPWSAPKMIGLLVTFAVLFVAFVVVEVLTPETAMTPTRVVLNRSIAASMLFIFLISGSMMSFVYYLTLWFQAVKGDSAITAGISTIPLVLSMVLVGILASAFTQKIGYYVPSMLVAPVLCSIGAGLISTITPSSNHSFWIGYQVLFGLGVGCGFQTSNLAAQTVLPRADVPIGMALMFFMQQMGGAIFLAIDQNIFSTHLVSRLSGMAGLDAAKVVNSGATDLRKVVSPDQLDLVIDAYNYALARVFRITAILVACTILAALAMEWKSIKKPNGPGGAPKTAEAEVEKGEVGPTKE